MDDVNAAELLMARRRLKLRQKDAARILRINLGTLVDIEREVIVPVAADMKRLALSYKDFAAKHEGGRLAT